MHPDVHELPTTIQWSATDPSSGFFDPTDVNRTSAGLVERFTALLERGEGYFEISGDDVYPLLTLGFRGEIAVIQRFTSAENVEILLGDGTVSAGTVEVLVMNEVCEFDAGLASSFRRGQEVLNRFLSGAKTTDVETWIDL